MPEEISEIVLLGGRKQNLRRPADAKPGQFGQRLVRQQPPAQFRHRGFEIGYDVGEGHACFLFPPPLWGARRAKLALEAREEGEQQPPCSRLPPSPALPHKGGESR